MRPIRTTLRLVAGIAGRLPRIALAAAGGWTAYSAVAVDHAATVPPSLIGDVTMIEGPVGRIALYRRRGGDTGATVLLVHSVNAAASALEMRPLFRDIDPSSPVAALDLPGFGMSDRPNARYTPEAMAAAIEAAAEAAGPPVDLIALSLGSEFAALAASRSPDLVRSLTLLSPTGFGRNRMRGRRRRTPVGAFLDAPLVGQALFDLLVARPSIEFFLDKSFAGDPDPDLIAHAVTSGHAAGARHAPAAFLAGALFTPDAMERLYDAVDVGTLVLYDRDAYTDFGELASFVSTRPGWRAERIPGTFGLPHFDRPDETTAAIERFRVKPGPA